MTSGGTREVPERARAECGTMSLSWLCPFCHSTKPRVLDGSTAPVCGAWLSPDEDLCGYTMVPARTTVAETTVEEPRVQRAKDDGILGPGAEPRPRVLVLVTANGSSYVAKVDRPDDEHERIVDGYVPANTWYRVHEDDAGSTTRTAVPLRAVERVHVRDAYNRER